MFLIQSHSTAIFLKLCDKKISAQKVSDRSQVRTWDIINWQTSGKKSGNDRFGRMIFLP